MSIDDEIVNRLIQNGSPNSSAAFEEIRTAMVRAMLKYNIPAYEAVGILEVIKNRTIAFMYHEE